MQDDPVVVLVPLSQAVEELKAHPYAIANPSEVEGLIEWMLTADHIKGGAEGGYIEQTDAWVPLCDMDVRLEEQQVMVKAAYTAGNDHKEVSLPSFSKLACLAYLSIPESLLMENDPEDEDGAWDCEVLHGTVFTTVRLISPEDGEAIYFVGLTNEWEGLKLVG